MRKILLWVSIGIFVISFILVLTITMAKYKDAYNEAVSKAKEEFNFDYNEEIIEIKTEELNKSFVITIYGEKTLVTYIYHNKEIWNYENQSN